jgi:choline dehydrogenase
MKVLGIESGQDFINAPEANIVFNLFNFGDLITNFPNKYHWQMPSEPMPGLGGRVIVQDAGRALSGGSQINFMLMFRGSVANFDAFDASLGSPGYFDGASMTAVYQAMEFYNGHGNVLDLSTRGDGTLPTQTVRVDSVPRAPLAGTDSEAFVNLMVAAFPGENDIRDQSYNTPGYDLGISGRFDFLFDHATTEPYRWSGRKAFLGPDVMNQASYTGVAPRNFQILLNSTVERILFDGTTAIGVEYRASNGRRRRAYVRDGGEVIMGAGPHTALIMERSGIGPANVLAEAGVDPIVVNEHVGEHLRNQPLIQIPLFWPNATGVSPDGWNVPNAAGFAAEDVSGTDAPGVRSIAHALLTFIGVPGVVIHIPFQSFPRSEGHFHISSTNPYTEGRYTDNTFGNVDDLTIMRENVRYFISSLIAADPTVFPLTIDNATLYDDNALNEYLQLFVEPQAHVNGLTRMGTSAANSVVDSRFRVWGVNGLRVCDLSAQPLYEGNPTLGAFAFGDICGRMILEDANSLYVAKAETTRAAKAKAAHDIQENRRKTAEARKNKKREPRHHTQHVNFGRHSLRATDEEMWDVYERLLEALPTNLGPRKAQNIKRAVETFPYYQQLKAEFGAASEARKRAQQVQHMKPSLRRA